MASRTQRAEMASETLDIFKRGFYEAGRTRVDVSALHANSMKNSVLYAPEDIASIKLPENPGRTPGYFVSNTAVVMEIEVALKVGIENIGVLNFASAKNPGGGFLNGSNAQEESIALSSNLYLTQMDNGEFYKANKAQSSMLYTDHMIFSRDVVFIRSGEDSAIMLKQPFTASVLTCPAVNLGQYLLKKEGPLEKAEQAMRLRIRKVIEVFADQKVDALMLGAFGCGVFKNDPMKVARWFEEALSRDNLAGYFKVIDFAVYDNSQDSKIFNIFKGVFKAPNRLESWKKRQGM